MSVVKQYFSKMRGGEASPSRPSLGDIAWSWLGGMLAIAAVGWLSVVTDQPLIMAPFGASAVILFAIPTLPAAQPRNVIGGHLVAAVVGLIALELFGNTWWAMALGVGTAIALMLATRTVHPPAGANPILIAFSDADWSFLWMPAGVGAVVMVFVALVFNNLAPERRYPLYWR